MYDLLTSSGVVGDCSPSTHPSLRESYGTQIKVIALSNVLHDVHESDDLIFTWLL